MNVKRREYMVGVLPKRRILMRHGKSQGNQDTATYTTTPDHNIQLTVQGMAQALHTGEHLHRVMGSDGCSPDWRVQFYVFPYVHTQSMFHELRKCFLKKRVIGVREELRVRERDFRNFQVKERMKKGILYELMGSVEDVRNGFWIFNSKTV
ncbi:hypothetical protein JHK84_031848 [Glycine max]|nr:hypothetical protein JHK86_031709 [Glycine max]KAG5146305.1 hypothetical protein JHK84_031848 [Glycine max]